MNTNRDLNYRLYLQKTNGFVRTSFSKEFERYTTIREGNVELVKKNIREIRSNFFSGKGQLSDDPVRNVRYHVVIAVALIARSCVEGGLSHDVAYTLSDIYIQRADKCRELEKLLDILEEMQIDFATRMRELKKEHVISIHIRRCIDYIYNNLNDKLTLTQLSEVTGLNETYLSRLFRKETGASIHDFVQHAKISTAQNMLKYSDFSSSEIALSLGFSSQSAFISQFRTQTGMTPKKYRDTYAE